MNTPDVYCEYVTPREAAQIMGIRLDAVYRLLWAYRLPATKKEGRWLISKSAVEARAMVGRRGDGGDHA